jgi:hypothetical protein
LKGGARRAVAVLLARHCDCEGRLGESAGERRQQILREPETDAEPHTAEMRSAALVGEGEDDSDDGGGRQHMVACGWEREDIGEAAMGPDAAQSHFALSRDQDDDEGNGMDSGAT